MKIENCKLRNKNDFLARHSKKAGAFVLNTTVAILKTVIVHIERQLLELVRWPKSIFEAQLADIAAPVQNNSTFNDKSRSSGSS